MEGIYLKNALDDYGYIQISNMMDNVEGIKDVFYGKYDRIITSEYSYLIMKNELVIGFINLVREKGNKDFLFIDMGIKPEYRKQGIGTWAIERVKKVLLVEDEESFVIGQTKINNKGGNGSIKDLGCFIGQYDDTNLYLLQEARVKELIDGGYYTELMNHLEKPAKRKQLFK